MKKLLVLAAVAAMALVAKAESTCYLNYVQFNPAAGDTSPATENLTQKGYYQCYIIQHSGSQSIDDYVKANTMESIAKQSITTFDYGNAYNKLLTNGRYRIDGYAAKNGNKGDIPVPEGFNPANAYAVVYYLGGEETPSVYLALSNSGDYAEAGEMLYMPRSESWQTYTAPTPEPTSGLLLLLGMAGLALKRKVK